MKASNSILIIFILLICSCSPWKQLLVSKGGTNEAVKNAITDFMNTCYLRNDDSIFSISIYIDNKDILGVSIFGQDKDKLFPGSNDKIGSYSKGIPNKYMIVDGKLFYWWSDTLPHIITREMVDVLQKYNHIDSMNVDSFVAIPASGISEKKKACHYYFCKNNLKNYKKIVTNRAMGWYKQPELECDKK